MDKYAVAQILREIGFAIELVDENPQKGFAYLRAAKAIESVQDFDKILAEKSLELIPGIGKKISGMIELLVEKAHLPYHQELLSRVPEGLFELALIPGLGSKRVRILFETFNVKNISELESIFRDEKVRKPKGFGPAYIKKILKHISTYSAEGASLLYPQALAVAQALENLLKPLTEKLEITGELRRKSEVIKQIDFIGISKNPSLAITKFIEHPLIKNVISQEDLEACVILKQGLKANLYLCSSAEFPFKLLNTTGNKTHFEDLEKEAFRIGYNLKNDSLKSSEKKPIKKIKKEEEIYKQLNLQFIPPELREGYGEIEAAKKNAFKLIQGKDLRGAFHCHTVDSDGINTIEEMAKAAKELGWEYIGITDHSKSSYQANGMSRERLFNQIYHIRQLNQVNENSFHIFSGLECDILKDGDLDFSDDVLKELDFVIASIHSLFKLEESLMTKRIIRAIENPYTTIIGHLTGRLLRHRDPYQLDIHKVIDACIANNKVIELNAFPSRLDMDWRLWIKAKEKGLKCCISPDAHSVNGLMNCQYGINIARKGWLEKEDVINTYSLREMENYLECRFYEK